MTCSATATSASSASARSFAPDASNCRLESEVLLRGWTQVAAQHPAHAQGRPDGAAGLRAGLRQLDGAQALRRDPGRLRAAVELPGRLRSSSTTTTSTTATAPSWATTAFRRPRSSARPGSSCGSSGSGWSRSRITWPTGRTTSSTPSTCSNVAPGRPSRSPSARRRRASSSSTTSRHRPSARRAFASTARACMTSWPACCRRQQPAGVQPHGWDAQAAVE